MTGPAASGENATLSTGDHSNPRHKRSLWAWCLFDWANSAYPTVVVTFIVAAYVTTGVATDPESGTAAWGNAMSLSGLSVAVLAPILGAIADQGGPRKPWLGVLSAITIATAFGLWFVEPNPSFLLLALLLAGAGSASFELGTVFYNAMLPEVAPPEKLGRISGWAWGIGYAGGLAALVVCLVVFIQPETPPFGLDASKAEPVRMSGPLIGLWFLLFGLPLFFLVPDRPASQIGVVQAVRRGFVSLKHSLKRLPRRRRISRFLIAHMLYTDGLNTLFAFGGIYAAGTFGMSFQEILVFAILLNVTSGLGALGFAWVDDWIGPKPTILIALGALTLLSGAVLLVSDKLMFYVLGCAIGIFIGPAQAASRSLMARLAKPDERTEMFGLYALSGKATAFMGPFLVGWLTLAFDSQRAGMASIVAFFVVGFLILAPLKSES